MTPATTVVNISHGDACDVYIGRNRAHNHHWGNPFRIGTHGSRADVIHKFDLWMDGIAYTHIEPERRAWMLANIHTLKGKRLGCFCKPDPCHGDILARIADEYESNIEEAS